MDLDDIILNMQIINVLENAEIAGQRRRIFNIRDDPFELDSELFIKLFHLFR